MGQARWGVGMLVPSPAAEPEAPDSLTHLSGFIGIEGVEAFPTLLQS